MPFIQYKFDSAIGTINVFDQLSIFGLGGSSSIANPDQGVMYIKNFDFVGSYSGAEQLALTDEHLGTLGMVFKKANPIWDILAHLPDSAINMALTGGGNAFGPLIDMAQTAAANDNKIQYLKEVA